MRKHPFSDDAVEALLRGEAPPDRPDLATLAGAVAELRATSSGTPPQPTAALANLLDHGHVGGLSTDKGDLPATAASNAARPAQQVFRLPKWRKKMIVEWIAGMGLAAKLGLGATVAAASVAGAGAGGVLPGPAQGAFDSVVSVVAPVDPTPDAGTPVVDPTPATEPTPEPDPTGTVDDDATDAAEDAADDAADAEEQAREDAEDAAGDAADAEEQAREDAADAEEQAREDAEEQAHEEARDAAKRDREQARDDAEQAEEAAERAREKDREAGDRAADDSSDD